MVIKQKVYCRFCLQAFNNVMVSCLVRNHCLGALFSLFTDERMKKSLRRLINNLRRTAISEAAYYLLSPLLGNS